MHIMWDNHCYFGAAFSVSGSFRNNLVETNLTRIALYVRKCFPVHTMPRSVLGISMCHLTRGKVYKWSSGTMEEVEGINLYI